MWLLYCPFLMSHDIQWASNVEFQYNNYGTQNWSGKQALGRPNAFPYGKTNAKAFRLNSYSTYGTLIVSYDKPQYVQQVIILENFNPGRVTNIYLFDVAGKKYQVFKSPALVYDKSNRTFCLQLPRTTYKVSKVELTIDTSVQKGWCQIDAIGIADYSNLQLLESDLQALHVRNFYVENSFTSEKEDLGFNINTSYSEIKPIISPDGKTLYFVRQNYPGNVFGKQDPQDIYFSNWEYGEWSMAKNIGSPLNNAHPNGVSSVSADGNTLLLINHYQKQSNGADLNGISISKRTRNGWGYPSKVFIKGFDNLSKFADYALSSNGKVLLMAIEQPDSFGDQDIYVSFLEDGNIWSYPINIGANINTSEAEFSPFLAADDKTLYFASEGHGGFGGSDIFYTQRIDDSWKNWTKPQNLGLNVNSKSWDAYYSIPASGEYAYFVHGNGSRKSPRNIYRIALPQELRPEPVILVSGQTFDAETSKPIEASIFLEKNNISEKRPSANSAPKTGNYSLIVPFNSDLKFQVKAEGYHTQYVHLDIADSNNYQEIVKNINLEPIPDNPVVKLDNIYFEEGKTEILANSNGALQSVIKLLQTSPNFRVELEGHTDNRGSLHLKHELSQERTLVVKNELIKAGIKEERITTAAYGGTKPVASNEYETSRKFNRRVELKVMR